MHIVLGNKDQTDDSPLKAHHQHRIHKRRRRGSPEPRHRRRRARDCARPVSAPVSLVSSRPPRSPPPTETTSADDKGDLWRPETP